MFQVCIHAGDCIDDVYPSIVLQASVTQPWYTENFRLVEDGLKHSQVVKITKHGITELSF